MPDFPHLPLPQKASGVYNAPRGGSNKKISEITSANKSNRIQHGLGLKAKAESVLNSWQSKQEERLKNKLPELPDSKTPTEPKKSKNERERRFLRRYTEWQASMIRHEMTRDRLELERQEEFQNFLESLDGELISSFVSFSDSFCCRLKINGNALKDL